jgi:Cdc6-like AAA superfamily ATPase
MSRNYGVNDIHSWKFDHVSMPEHWTRHLGNLAENFRMIIEGKSGHGKTEYVMQLTKMLAIHYGKVALNNVEQGRSASFQSAFIRNNMHEIPAGKWMLADASQRVFDKWFKRLEKRASGRVIVLDSLDYMHLTLEQFQQLHERFPRKAIIIVCWNDPMDFNAKKIKYMCDIKVEVKDFQAHVRSRFGGNHSHQIWDKKINGQRSLF